MKILILQDDFPPDVLGGAEVSTLDLAHGLQKAGQEVVVLTTCRKRSDEGNTEYEGVKVIKIFADYHERWRAYLSLYNPQTVGKVKKLIKEINPDVVHAQNIHYYLSYYSLRAVKKMGKPVFLTIRDVMPFNYGKLATEKYLKKLDARTSWRDHIKQAGKRYNPFRNIAIRCFLRRYPSQVFAISEALKKALGQNGINNVEVVHNGIDVESWYVSPEKVENFKNKYNLQAKKVVLFGGRISGLKGSEQINRAMLMVKKEIPEAELLIVGKEGTGWLTGEDLRAAYWASSVVVMPSVCFDAFGRVNIEGMACKKPVIATVYGGAPEVVQDGITGYIINPFKVELMAEKIVDLLKNKEKAVSFGEAGYQRAKELFSSDSQAAKYISWYKKAK